MMPSSAEKNSETDEPEVPFGRVAGLVRHLAHDFRNGLNSLDLQTAFLQELVTPDSEAMPEIKRLRAMIATTAKSLQALSGNFWLPEPHQRFGNWLATTLIRLLYRHRYSDLGPFRAIRTSTLLKLGMLDRNYGWTVEMQVRALQQGLRVLEVPVSYGLRQAGEPKVAGRWDASLRAGWVILTTIARLRWPPH